MQTIAGDMINLLSLSLRLSGSVELQVPHTLPHTLHTLRHSTFECLMLSEAVHWITLNILGYM